MMWMNELPAESYLLEKPAVDAAAESGQYRAVVIDPAVFAGVSDYTQSQPTGPSAGRVYRKNLGWPEHVDDNWFLYVVIDAPDGDGQLHVPYAVLTT